MTQKKPQTDERDHTPENKHRHVHHTLPDPAICRAKQTHANLVDCLVEHTSHCRYALRFGHGIFCRHPEAQEIVKRTEAEKNKKKG